MTRVSRGYKDFLPVCCTRHNYSMIKYFGFRFEYVLCFVIVANTNISCGTLFTYFSINSFWPIISGQLRFQKRLEVTFTRVKHDAGLSKIERDRGHFNLV